MKLKVDGIKEGEVYRDIARIPEQYRRDTKDETIKEGKVCKLTVGDKTTRVSIRGLLGCPDARIQLDEYTRNKLGIRRGSEVDVVLTEEGICGELCWAWNASDPAYRIAARLAALSVALGGVGLVCGLISLFR